MMNSEFMKHFNWVKEMLNQKLDGYFDLETVEYAILHRLHSEWSEENGLQLLKDLDEKYGETAKRTVSEFMKANILRDWAAIGERDAHEGTEIDDFFRVLWEPLKNTGFEYTRQNKENIVELIVTRCPVFELAEKTGMHEWFYHMACTSDFYTTPSFKKTFFGRIGFILPYITVLLLISLIVSAIIKKLSSLSC